MRYPENNRGMNTLVNIAALLGKSKHVASTTQGQGGRPRVGDSQMLENAECDVLVDALTLVNEYMAAEKSRPQSCTEEKFHEFLGGQRDIVQKLVHVHHPLAQVIAAQLQMDGSSVNCKRLIRELAEEVESASL